MTDSLSGWTTLIRTSRCEGCDVDDVELCYHGVGFVATVDEFERTLQTRSDAAGQRLDTLI